MKKNIFNHSKAITLLVFVLMLNPSLIKAQTFIDGVIDSIIVMPVNLTIFTAFKVEKNVQLNWTTASEKNNSHFNVQRSIDGINFENIAKISTKGNTSIIQNYSCIDANVPNNNLYYKLQQVDIDGKSTLSNIILVKNSKTSNAELSIYPNPLINNKAIVTLKNAPIGQYILSLKSISGKTLFINTMNQLVTDSNREISIPSSISKGFYILNVASIDGKINLTQKIIIE